MNKGYWVVVNCKGRIIRREMFVTRRDAEKAAGPLAEVVRVNIRPYERREK